MSKLEREVYVAGVGLTAVGEHWDRSLTRLAWQAWRAARTDAPGLEPQALYIGNMLGGKLSRQQNMGALLTGHLAWGGIEAVTIEAAGASGAAALRQGILAVAAGQVDVALVLGVEKMTEMGGPEMLAASATATDGDWEAPQGVTPVTLAALLMRRYMQVYGVAHRDFAGFSINAHANAANNPNAMFRNSLSLETYLGAAKIADPLNLFDAAPDADGAAALLLTAAPAAVRVAASTTAASTLAIHDRPDMLDLEAARLAAARAYEQAGIGPDEIDVFELHDAFSILAALSLEAANFAPRGEGWRPAQYGDIRPIGRIPISTFGGLKARGNPGGATGVYQAAEIVLQLRGTAGANQVPEARWGMAQSLGSTGALAVTHIFERVDQPMR